jgi:hypothetical protein
MPRARRDPTAAERAMLAKLAALTQEVVDIQTAHATDIAIVNRRRVQIIEALRDGPDGGVPVMRQATEIGVHYTTLFRLLPGQPKPGKTKPRTKTAAS